MPKKQYKSKGKAFTIEIDGFFFSSILFSWITFFFFYLSHYLWLQVLCVCEKEVCLCAGPLVVCERAERERYYV